MSEDDQRHAIRLLGDAITHWERVCHKPVRQDFRQTITDEERARAEVCAREEVIRLARVLVESESGEERAHIETCAVAMVKPCRVSGGEHRWSGWPGAYCLDCFADDDMEFCIGTVCRCPCHDQLMTVGPGLERTAEPAAAPGGGEERR